MNHKRDLKDHLLRNRLLILGVLACFITGSASAAIDGKTVIGKDTLGAFYLNIGKIYEKAMTILRTLDKPEQSTIRLQLTKFWETASPGFEKALKKAASAQAASAQAGSEPVALPKLETLIAKVVDFDSRELFRPNGGLWISVDASFTPRLVLEAKVKPKELYDVLASMDETFPKPEKAEKDLVQFRSVAKIQGVPEMVFSFAPEGIILEAAGFTRTDPTPDWNSFFGFVTSSGSAMILELDGKRINQLVEQKSPGKAPDPRIKSLSRVIFSVSGQEGKLVAAVGDPQMRDNFKNLFKMSLQQAKTAIQQKAALPGAEAHLDEVKNILEKVIVIDRDGSVGFSIEHVSNQFLLTAGVGIIGVAAAVAIPNFVKTRDTARVRACNANMRTIQGAIELYNLDNKEPLKQLDTPTLVEKAYLKGPPMCPDGGIYSMDGLSPHFQIRCSRHGTFPGQ